jgi:hypothetical protein
MMEITPDHPVYVEGKGWVWTENLVIGDRLRRADGGWAKVLAIERVRLAEPEVVYNFTVKGLHTYFVLEVEVLVHNRDCLELAPDATPEDLEKFATDIGIDAVLGENISKEARVLAGAQLAADGTHEALSTFKAVNGRGVRTWEEFETVTAGHFESIEKAKAGWQVYQETNLSDDILVIGRQPDTEVVKLDNWANHRILDNSEWSIAANDAWIQGGIDRGAVFYLGSPQTFETLWNYEHRRPTVYARELEQLKRAGYIQVGNSMVPSTYIK